VLLSIPRKWAARSPPPRNDSPPPPRSPTMTTIGIIGSGNIGSNVARAAVAGGHTVLISNSRGPESLQDLIAELGPNASAATTEQAATTGELVLVAIPLGRIGELDAEPFDGK